MSDAEGMSSPALHSDVSARSLVLVVDDEPGIIRLCQRLLDRAGFDVIAVSQPQESLEILERQRVDLLLVDIRMPGIDGFQVVDHARRHQPDAAIVIMTGFGTVEMAIESLRRGADGLILKPFSGSELVESVKRALQENQNKRDVSRLQTLRPLFNVTEALFSETDPLRLQDLVIEAICGHLHCTQAGLYYRKNDNDPLKLIAHRGTLPFDGDSHVVGEQIVERAVAEGFPLWLNREGPDDRRFPSGKAGADESSLQVVLTELGVETAICAPVTLKDSQYVGWAARDIGAAAFRASDLEMFVILVRQAAVALENAHLNAELRASLRQVEESQRALLQAEKMATAGRLTASIAHEINNPLQAVQNCLHLAGRNELSDAARQNYLALAQNELERLMHTVQRMLEFYRPGAVDRKSTDINELLRKVLLLLEKQLQDRHVRVQTRLSSRLPLAMVVKDQMQQVFLNLLLNAIEAMPEGGEIFLTTTLRKKEIEIQVEDTGPGVPDEQRQQIFEPFVSTKEDGTGLGLAVSYGIMAAHGGSLDLISGRGRGACFRITLPVGEET